MRRFIVGFALASLLVGEVFAQTDPVVEDRSAYAVGDRSGYRLNATDEQLRNVHMLGIAVEDDDDLRKQRAICDRGEMPDFRQTLEARGTPFPRVEVFCRATLAEEGKRGNLFRFRHRDDYAAITAATQRQITSYMNYTGEQQTLACETAYDVGYEYGWQKPDSVFQPSLRSRADAHSVLCFNAGGLHPTLGLVAGVHHGQADRRSNG